MLAAVVEEVSVVVAVVTEEEEAASVVVAVVIEEEEVVSAEAEAVTEEEEVAVEVEADLEAVPRLSLNPTDLPESTSLVVNKTPWSL